MLPGLHCQHMTQLAARYGLIVVICAACSAQTAPVATGGTSKRPGETCPSFDVSADASTRLAGASNVLEYENIWKQTHPGSSTGTISGSAVRSLIRSKQLQLQACYELALEDTHEASGRVVVRFIVDASGQVANANISSNSFDRPDIGCCVLARVADWTFPAPTADGFVAVEYPFVVRISHGK
jgi:TonB family protein